jgi:ligand-binding SRPBCC domain-containing protein
MPRIELFTLINAPVETCFELSLSADVHTLSTTHTLEEAISGKAGTMKFENSVTWKAKHFGMWQQLTSKITEYRYPTYFCDEMVKGIFKSIRHEHHFLYTSRKTIMTDVFLFEAPLGFIGKVVSKWVLKRYLQKLLSDRNRKIKLMAERAQRRKMQMA